MREQLVNHVEIIPIEFVVRNIASGSLTKRLGIEDGTVLKNPLLEYCLKKDELDDPLSEVETVVLDECHYMNDYQRGTVWEESIIHCPSRVQLVALSATVENADQLTDWISTVHGPTKLIKSDHRPVPLQFGFCSAKGLHPLLNKEGKAGAYI